MLQVNQIHILCARRSSTHFRMCAIHSFFSVAVAAYTTNDFLGLIIFHPLRKARMKSETVLKENDCRDQILFLQ